LGKQGIEIDIYTRAHDPADAQVYYPSENVRLIHIYAGEIKEMGKMPQYSHLPDFSNNLEEFSNRNNISYDLVHSHYWLSGKVGQQLSQLWHAPHIVMFHTLGSIKERLGIIDNEIKLRIATEEDLLMNCNRIIAATEKEKEDLMKYHKTSSEKIAVIPCGVNLDLFNLYDKKAAKRSLSLNNNKVILFVGRMEPLKGIEKLLTAISYLKDLPKLKLVIIGGDDKDNLELFRLKDMVNKLHIDNSVLFLGAISQEKLPLFYNAADICVVPSYYESFCLVILESLASGTPVVSTNVGIAEDIIQEGKNGYLIEDNEPYRIANVIEQLLIDNKNGRIHVDIMRRSVLGFSWSNIALSIINEYDSLLTNEQVAVPY
jgi:D-inositol-3-phosphate glycosyltransferase